ncbi:MAG: S8 family serine peptidase [Anaerolineae bacterium]
MALVLSLSGNPDAGISLPTLASFPTQPATSGVAAAPSLTPVSNIAASATLDEPVTNRIILRFDPNSTVQQRMEYIAAIQGTIALDLASLNTAVVSLPEGSTVDSLPTSSVVLSHEADYYAVAQQDASDDPHAAEQWALPLINAPAAWSDLPNSMITVAVIDSGICAEHPDLAGRIIEGYDFVEGDFIPQDDLGHGCGVAGVIAANVNNGLGMAGVAPNTRIMPLKVLNSQGIGTYSDVASAILYAADHGAQIVNLSLGGTQPSDLLENAVNYAISRGVIIIAAAGNTGNRTLVPASYANVIAVGSIDRSMQPSSFSAMSKVDLFAPGRDILTLQTDGDYALMSGTSFAAPQVTGIAALEMAYGRTLTLNGGIVSFGGTNAPVNPTATPNVFSNRYAELLDTVRAHGTIRVIVSLNVNFQPESLLSPQAVETQQTMIAQAQRHVAAALAGYNAILLSQSDQWVVPGIAYQVDEAGLLYLMSLPEVVNLVEDIPMEQALDSSAGIVGAPDAWALGYTGMGQTVVIIDSGIERTHSTFGGRVVGEACYSWNQADNPGTTDYNERNDSLCGNGSIQQFSVGAADVSRCTVFGVDCSHGTHVAGIAAGGDSTYRGIAPAANIIAIQVFTRWEDCPTIPGIQQCILSYTSDQMSALNYVYTNLRASYDIAAINLSIGSGRYYSACDNQNPEMTNIINQLYAARIATVIASSNNGYSDSISFPACVTSAVSVASSSDTDTVSSFSNADDTLDLLAPGESIMSSIPGNVFGVKTGTSMATPHVVGAFALLRQAVPSLTVEQGLSVLQTTGIPIVDARNGLTFRRINVANAVNSFTAPTETPSAYQTATISDQALLAALQNQANSALRPVLVVITPAQMEIYVDVGGTVGRAAIEVVQGNQVVALSITQVTDANGETAPQFVIDAVNTHLPLLLSAALDQVINAQFGGSPDTADITLYHNYLDVGVTP